VNHSATFSSHTDADTQSTVDHIVITESLTAHVVVESFIGTAVTSNHEPLVRKLLKTTFNKLNTQIRRDINKYREETWIKTCESLDYRDGKNFWNKFKVITGQKRNTNHHLATDAHIYYTPQELLDGIHQVPNDPNFNATFFDQIANNVHAFKNVPLIDPLPHPLHNEHLTDDITTDEVKTIISLLKNTKAPGPDQIRPILLKNLPDPAFQALTDIYNNYKKNTSTSPLHGKPLTL
jgi:hypothetical protein